MDNDALPLYPQCYPPAKVVPSEADHHIMNQSPNMSSSKPTSSAPPPPLYNHQPLLLGPENTISTCPFCNASIKTAVRYTTTSRTHIAAALCSFICCCCCLPYSMDSCKNADHYCPNCQRYLGTYER